jgi:hypothetical protein
MNVKEKYEHWLAHLLKASAVTIGHTVYYAGKPDQVSERLRRHEMIHIRQYQDMGKLKFLFRYFKEYLGSRLRGNDHKAAYYSISFEKEAYEKENERNLL